MNSLATRVPWEVNKVNDYVYNPVDPRCLPVRPSTPPKWESNGFVFFLKVAYQIFMTICFERILKINFVFLILLGIFLGQGTTLCFLDL